MTVQYCAKTKCHEMTKQEVPYLDLFVLKISSKISSVSCLVSKNFYTTTSKAPVNRDGDHRKREEGWDRDNLN